MANINLNYDLNVSIQKGDTLYASKLTGDTKPKILGSVDGVNHGSNTLKLNIEIIAHYPLRYLLQLLIIAKVVNKAQKL